MSLKLAWPEALERFKGKYVKGQPLRKAGYVRMVCPVCRHHIGTDINVNTRTGEVSVKCGVCDTDLYRVFKATSDLERGKLERTATVMEIVR